VFTVPGDAKQIVLGFTLALLFVVAGIGLMVWGRVEIRSDYLL
jgi:hypothetical protein